MTAFLKVKEGHYVTVKRNSIAGLVLCVVELKEEATFLVKVWTRNGTTNQIAFSFKKNEVNYSLKVEEKKLQLADVSEIHEPYWFEKVNLNANEYYGLQSVVNPGHPLYISIDDSKETSVFCLSEDSQACAELTDEA